MMRYVRATNDSRFDQRRASVRTDGWARRYLDDRTARTYKLSRPVLKQ